MTHLSNHSDAKVGGKQVISAVKIYRKLSNYAFGRNVYIEVPSRSRPITMTEADFVALKQYLKEEK
jgi:hypothetical protein